MSIAAKIHQLMSQSSWIREMFEEGDRLKTLHGTENVFDFSLGNPNLPPPPKFNQVLKEIVASCDLEDHCYMPQAGYPQVCRSIAEYLSNEQGVSVSAKEIFMTCGAAGALNVILKALLDPDDEVIVPTPCFVEYRFYADNHGGKVKFVPTHADFSLDIDAIAAAITQKTKAVLINSPNNPTGQVYSRESLEVLATLLTTKSQALKRTLYLICDEPYRKIVYENRKVPSIFKVYKNGIIVTSYSKDLSIPGERIGFAAINPKAEFKADLLSAMSLTHRILGFVNAPALMQRVVGCLQGLTVDVAAYERKRDLICSGLSEAGYEFSMPCGAFYLFPRAPIKDDVQFVSELHKERILVVPGSGFNGPGFFRIAFCVDDKIIINAMPGFKRVMARYS
jgi:aspartate aminotransferase